DASLGYDIGPQYEPIDEVTLDFTYKSEVTTKFEGDATFANLDVGFPDKATGGAEITLPSSVVAALNLKPVAGLTTELDVVWWGWSSYDELAIQFDEAVPALGGSTITNERNYKNAIQFRFGAEYDRLGIEGLTIRAGVGHDSNPIRDRYVGPTLPDSRRWLFSCGLTYSLTTYLDIDASYILISATQRNVSNTHEGAMDGVYTTDGNLPGLGLTLKL